MKAPTCEALLCCHPQRLGGHFDALVGVRCTSSGERRGDGRVRCWVHECAFRAGRLLAYAASGAELARLFEASL